MGGSYRGHALIRKGEFMRSKTDRLRQICEEIIHLESSPLYSHRKKHRFSPVVGEGNHNASLMFIAEAPGINEAKTGHHFVGQSGKVFDELLLIASLKRKDIYVTNIIKDKLPQNRNPIDKEIAIYAPFLIRQIQIIKPKKIVTLGTFSTNFMMEKCGQKKAPMNKIHGRHFKISCSYGLCDLIPMYHPSAGLYNQKLIGLMKEDFLGLNK